MKSYDEESALLDSGAETFDVPSTDVKRFRKFTILSIALATLVLCCVAFRPDDSQASSGPADSMQMQEVFEVGRLDNGEPQLAKKGDSTEYPKGFQLFTGDRPVPHKSLPKVGESYTAYDKSMPKAKAPVHEKLSSVDPVTAALHANPSNITEVNVTTANDKGDAHLADKEPQSWEAIKAEQAKMSKEEKSSPEGAAAAVKEADSSLLLCTTEISRKNEMYAAPKGCALISDEDLTFNHAKSHTPANVLVICAPASIGTFPLDEETLESFGLVKDGKSLISSVIAGEETSIGVYSGSAFDGSSYVVQHTENIDDANSLLNTRYVGSQLVPNDNIKSLIFQTTASSTPRTCKNVKYEIGFKESR